VLPETHTYIVPVNIDLRGLINMSRWEILTKKQKKMAKALLASGFLSVMTQKMLHYVSEEHRQIACQRLEAIGIARVDFGNLYCTVAEVDRPMIIQQIMDEEEKVVSLRNFF